MLAAHALSLVDRDVLRRGERWIGTSSHTQRSAVWHAEKQLSRLLHNSVFNYVWPTEKSRNPPRPQQNTAQSLSPKTPTDKFIIQRNKLEQQNMNIKIETWYDVFTTAFLLLFFELLIKAMKKHPSTRTQLVEKTTHKRTCFFSPPSTAETTAVLGGKAFVLLVIILTPGQAKETEPCVI